MAGIQNIWSKSLGQTKNKINVITATMQALRKLSSTKSLPQHVETLSMLDGSQKKVKVESNE